MGIDLPGQRPDRRASASSGPCWWSPTRRTRTRDRPDPRRGRCSRSPAWDCCSGRSSRAPPGGGPRGRSWAPGWPAWSCWAASSPGSPAARIPCSNSSSSATAGSRSPSPPSAWGCSGSWGRCSCRPSSSSSISGYSPLQAGLRILPSPSWSSSAPWFSRGRSPGGHQAHRGGRPRVDRRRPVASLGVITVRHDLRRRRLGLLLIGLGAGLMLPTATNSVIGSVPQGDSGMGSATNTVALQVGGALGVAVIGSVMLYPLPEPHGGCVGRSPRAHFCRADRLRVSGRCPGGGGTRRRLNRDGAGPRRARPHS